jgi:hypothetical protein
MHAWPKVVVTYRGEKSERDAEVVQALVTELG